ncbi:hypothetical protein [Aquimarina algiphila]|uniref:hypothetical protein n=1 Tax=Aquimarina algiphila TaxID=2047982 RepID=UPI0024912424|nr:hypothetical protein [Aquimarina algiphila]
MKKILLALVLVFTFSFAFSTNKDNTISLITEVENVDEEGLCRWRVCTTSGGERTCGEWTYAYCLDEVVIEG